MADIGGTGPVTATPAGAPNNQLPSPTLPRPSEKTGLRWKEILLRDVVIAALIGLLLFGVSYWFEQQRASQAERLENLRFVRDVATRESGRMPFRGLNLEDMNLGGLSLACQDEPEDRVEGGCSMFADFTDADLSGADMSEMNLDGAVFTGADLQNADLGCSSVSHANFTGANMAGVKLEEVGYSVGATGPDGGALFPEEEHNEHASPEECVGGF
jgi:hypothetical protein